MSSKNIQEDALLSALLEAKPEAIVSGSAQEKLLSNYNTIAVPTKKNEAYRYSSLAKQFEAGRSVAQTTNVSADVVAKHILSGVTSFAVFVNGVYNADLSVLDVDNLTVEPISGDNAGEGVYADKFSALNAAFATDGLSITIKKGKAVEETVQFIYINDTNAPAIANVKNVIVAEEQSQAKFVSVHVSEQSQLLTNIHTDITVKENANVEVNVFTNESSESIQVNNINVTQAKQSIFTGNVLTLNGGSVRTNLVIDQNDEYCETNLNGLYLPSGSQHFDNYVLVNHNKPNCTTNEVFKGIAKDKGTGVFAGSIYVAPDAQKTLANQSNKNILMSNDATIHSKPELKIYADDVSCSHGSTTGQLDKEQIFYMQSRGINRDKAVHLLLAAFFGDVTDNLTNEALKEKVVAVIETEI